MGSPRVVSVSQVNRPLSLFLSVSPLAFQLSLDQARLCGLLSKAVGKANSEVTRRLSKVGQFTQKMCLGPSSST